jgi:4a-hydroxytetrahydrobiopterin dehydratase
MAAMTGSPDDLSQQLALLPDWEVVDGHHLHRLFRFRDFVTALAWVNLAGAVCEEQGHHADFQLGWGSVRVEIFTHDHGGLSELDSRLALALDQLPRVGELP